MAVLVGRRALLQVLRVQAAEWDSACRPAATIFGPSQYVFSGTISPFSRQSRPGAVTRHYSSDSKDDLRVRYLDREDAGKFRPESEPIQMHGQYWKNSFCCQSVIHIV